MLYQAIYDMISGVKTRLNMKSTSEIFNNIQKEGQVVQEKNQLDALSEEYKEVVE